MMKKYFAFAISAVALMACQAQDKADTNTMADPVASKTAYQKNQDSPMAYTKAGQTDADHLWLEEVEGERALAQVRAWNTASSAKMQTQVYQDMNKDLRKIYNSDEKIPYVSYRAGHAHNFWQDGSHVKGIWRTTNLQSYLSDTPKWDTMLDIDVLAKAENKNWVYKGNTCLAPDYKRCMVNLSIGGKDAVERREFDTASKAFVKGGFVTPESKGSVDWLDKDHLIIGVNFGEGTMTDSGYPRQVRLWPRGTPLAESRLLFEGPASDVASWGYSIDTLDGRKEIIIQQSETFYKTQYFWLNQSGENAFERVKIPVPKLSSLSGQFKGQELLSLQEDWRGFKSGALVSFSLEDFIKDGKIDTLHEVLTPNAHQSIENFGITKSKVLLSLYEDVSGAAYALDYKDGVWSKTKLDFPENGSVSIGATNDKEDIAFVNTESFLDPDTLWTIDTSDMKITKAKHLPQWFDSADMVTEQKFATSTDGTKIPYYIVRPKDAKMDGTNPTILYGYGGFEISINPSYSATIGREWLARGGIYVSANIRGGGEYGPAWHQAGLKQKRQIIYDDFIAVAQDLIDQGVTTPAHLGIHGRSNGGLLMGVMFTQRPDLFGAVAIGVPLLDMRRYHKLLAGASWVGEYGDPDDQGPEGAFIRALSPYHNIRDDVDYPMPYIYTSTKDDRVHPGHARKFAKRLEDLGLPFLYYENIDGGHAGAANLDETAHSYANIYSYFYTQLAQ